jgi:hypothetical protein
VAYFDDVYFGEQGAAMASQELFVPAGASAAGDKGTFWTTELWVHNAVQVPITLEGAVMEADKDNSAAIAAPTELAVVPAEGFVTLADVFGRLGKSVTGGLYLRATAQSGSLPATLMVVMSRTSTPNPEGGGSYGQALPAVGEGVKGMVISPGVFQSADYRTNVGVLNTSASQIELDVDVRDSAGIDVRTARWTLRPYEFKLRSVSSLGVSSLDGGTVYFILRSSSGSFRAFTSTADNTTGDPVYNAAQ